MGLFRRAKKNRGKPAGELLTEQATTVKAQPEVAPREVKFEARPNPDEPGWGAKIGTDITRLREKPAGELLTEQPTTVKAQPEVARRQVKYEARPNPNEPGWGSKIGMDITRLRRDRASQE